MFPPFFFEERIDALGWIAWTGDHMEIPVTAVGLYLLMIFNFHKVLDKPIECKGFLAIWNLSLAIFSMYGASRLVPYAFSEVKNYGFRDTICANDLYHDEAKPQVAYWVALFIYSKYAELMDTVFLVIRKKRVIFLHWFHHVTVLLYCQHAWAHMIAGGIWFAAMNYSVHSIMYFYYFLTNRGYYKQLKPIAPFITLIQILQMCGGMYVLLCIAYEQNQAVQLEGESWKEAALRTCRVDPANWKMGLLMYFSYFILFVVLFYDKYCATTSSKNPKVMPCAPTQIYGKDPEKVGGAGFFHMRSQSKKVTDAGGVESKKRA